MNFFESQARARSHSRRLVVLFAVAVALIVAAVNAVVVVALAVLQQEGPHAGEIDPAALAQQSPQVLVAVTLIVVGIVAGASFFKILRLRSGGGAVARALGAQLVSAQAGDAKIRRLRNVVEEIAIASGVAVPQVYVLEDEPAINAFAAGFSPADAAVTVTRGALDKLSRDELQGVIAHEFSHIVNGDMRLSIQLMGVTFGILVIALVARGVLRATSRGRGKGKGPVVLAALAIMLIGYIGVFFARLIKAGFSRQRESLADASAVQFTRQTQGLAGALKKIAGLGAGSHLQSARTEEVSHMLFGEGMKLSSLFATHPPLGERIRALEPGFDLAQVRSLSVDQRWDDPAYAPDESTSAPIAGFAPARSVAAPSNASDLIAGPGPAEFQQAAALLAALPDTLKASAEDPARATALVLALLLDADAAVRARQLALIDAAARDGVVAAHAQLADLDPALRLPLAEVAFPTLRHEPRERLMALVALVSRLTQADTRVSIFEFCLGHMLRRFVGDALRPSKVRVAGKYRLSQCDPEAAGLLAAVAQHGSASAQAARQAYVAGLSHALPQSRQPYRSADNWPAQLDALLRTLDRLDGPGKELLLEGLVRTVSHDGRITIGEAELVRTIAAALHCPVPPLAAR